MCELALLIYRNTVTVFTKLVAWLHPVWWVRNGKLHCVSKIFHNVVSINVPICRLCPVFILSSAACTRRRDTCNEVAPKIHIDKFLGLSGGGHSSLIIMKQLTMWHSPQYSGDDAQAYMAFLTIRHCNYPSTIDYRALSLHPPLDFVDRNISLQIQRHRSSSTASSRDQ